MATNMAFGSTPGAGRRLLLATALACTAACGDDSEETRGSDAATTDATAGTSPTDASSSDGTGSESDPTTDPSGTGTDTATAGTTAGTAMTDPTTESTDPSGTDTDTDTGVDTTGEPCPADCEEMGGVCVGSTCCAPDAACGDVCCDVGDVCSFQVCVTPGTVCIDNADCDADEYCEFSLGEPAMEGMGECAGGFEPATGKCLPAPPVCPPDNEPEPGEEITCLTECQYVPDGSFSPVVKHHWSSGTVMMAPIVIQLDDDNCDGVVNEKDIPEILFHEFFGGDYNHNGRLHAISIVDGQIVEKWAFQPATDRIHPGREIAGGDLDGVPGSEIVMCTEDNKLRAVDAAGNPLWVSSYAGGCIHPSIVDMNGDGLAEVLIERAMIDGATGATLLDIPEGIGTVTGADINSDGELEIVGATKAYNIGGGLVAETSLGGLHPAIGDFDLDGKPEVAVIDNNGNLGRHHLIIWRYAQGMPGNVEIIRAGIDINGPLSNALCPVNSAGYKGGGGPPTIADFNGDGTPDVAVAGGVGYAVFDGTKIMDPQVADVDTTLWIKQTKDCSSAQTGSSVFDFDGDGSAEVVYSDEHYLRVYKGTDGEVIYQTCNTTGTLREFPLVADVDNDGQADIVAVSNNYSSITCEGTKQTGVRVYGDAAGQWVRTRRIWNQHSYHVTNINEDGSIPSPELSNWLQPGLNNFRQNVQPDGEFSAPDLVVELKRRCPPNEEYAIVGRVRNIGEAPAPAGVPVYFWEGDPDNGGVMFAQGVTANVLYPAQAEDVVVTEDLVPATVKDGTSTVWVVVDDADPQHPWHECKLDNNRDSGSGECNILG